MNNLPIEILNSAIHAVSPYPAVREALGKMKFTGKCYCLAIGKAACEMARGVVDEFDSRRGNQLPGGNNSNTSFSELVSGIAITKYGCEIPLDERIKVFSAGHPVPDKNTISATKKAIEFAESLNENDELIFLISGGGSAVFEYPKISLEELQSVTNACLKSGAPIEVLNDIRKRLSFVKGGGFLNFCRAKIHCLILSDVLGDDVSTIASGPCFAKKMNDDDLKAEMLKFSLNFGDRINRILFEQTDKNETADVDFEIVGNVKKFCDEGAALAEKHGYETKIISTCLEGEASDRAREICELAKTQKQKICLIYGGETTVTVRGHGLGGRNQELALAAAKYLKGTDNITLLSCGSDGTDGPTDAAGGIVDGFVYDKFAELGLDYDFMLADNDSYHALENVGCLVKTGATGTNVNDIVIVLID